LSRDTYVPVAIPRKNYGIATFSGKSGDMIVRLRKAIPLAVGVIRRFKAIDRAKRGEP
jgi:hypothetical protein